MDEIGSVISTGSLQLDFALQIGGIPRGQVILICGEAEAGKTTLCLHMLANAQKTGLAAVLLDTDQALVPQHATNCGVLASSLFVSRSSDLEQVLDTAVTLAKTGEVAAIAIDSINGLLTPLKPGQAVALRKQMACLLPELTRIARQTNTALLITQRISGGQDPVWNELHNPFPALKTQMSICLEVRLAGFVEENGQVLGFRSFVRISGSKFDKPIHDIELDILYNEGIIKIGDVFDLARQYGLIRRQGSMFICQELPIGKSRQQGMLYLRQNSYLANELEQALRHKCLQPGKMAVGH